MFFASCVAMRVTLANKVVFTGEFGPTASTSDTEKVEFTESFTLEEKGNLRITLKVPAVQQGYVGLLGGLVNEDTGEVTTFTTAAQYYSGSSGGERWSEGKRSGRTLLGKVPAGRYRMRLATRPYDKGTGQTFTVTAKTQVPYGLWTFLGFLALLVFPVIQSIRSGVFETKRWSKSDHAG